MCCVQRVLVTPSNSPPCVRIVWLAGADLHPPAWLPAGARNERGEAVKHSVIKGCRQFESQLDVHRISRTPWHTAPRSLTLAAHVRNRTRGSLLLHV